MAKIGPVLLDIQKVPNNLAADVEVLYTVTYDESDVRTNRSYDELVELFGVDDGPLNTRDEPIRFGRGRLPFHRGTIRADGNTSTEVRHEARKSRSDFNEDKPGRDEIRARVTLKSGSLVVVRESNLVIDDFNPAHA